MKLHHLLLFTVFLLAACGGRASQQDEDAGLSVDLVASSTAVGPTTLEITIADSNGAPIDDATLNVKGDMTHAGMTPVLAEGIGGGQQGLYTVPLEWTMAGDWIVTVEILLPDGDSVTRTFELSVAAE